MFHGFFQAICQIGVFMVCAQTITHFRPNKKYEQYLKFLVGIMILVQVFTPVMNLFTSGELYNIEERVKWFEEQLQESARLTNEAVIRSNEIKSLWEHIKIEEDTSVFMEEDHSHQNINIPSEEENFMKEEHSDNSKEPIMIDEIEITIR